MYHNPVLLKESVEGLNINPNGIYVDVTFGGGGHSREILNKLENGHLFAFDQDNDALKNTIDDPRFTLINNNFRYIKNFLKLHKCESINGILADLGVSSHQFDIPERGFSTRFEAPLDMRMNQNGDITAADIINNYTLEELKSLLYKYGELKNSNCFANSIVEKRQQGEIKTTKELIDSVERCYPKIKRNKILAQVFQALRIEVNSEMDALKEMLEQSCKILVPGGRIVVISYHSLEDRLVKNFIKSGNFEGKVEKDFYGNAITDLKQITRKPLIPSDEEIETNNRARSAKLRIAEKK